MRIHLPTKQGEVFKYINYYGLRKSLSSSYLFHFEADLHNLSQFFSLAPNHYIITIAYNNVQRLKRNSILPTVW